MCHLYRWYIVINSAICCGPIIILAEMECAVGTGSGADEWSSERGSSQVVPDLTDKARPILMRTSLMTPKPTHRFIPRSPL